MGWIVAIVIVGVLIAKCSSSDSKDSQPAARSQVTPGESTISATEKADQDREAAARQADRDREAAKNDPKCALDLQCLSDKFMADAQVRCTPEIERQAKYSSRWLDTSGMFAFEGAHLPRMKWLNKEEGSIRFLGDNVEFQNGFGAYQRSIFQCDFNTKTKTVLGVIVEPGHL